MYLQHFGLSDRPFRIVPSPRYFFVSETHDEGRARILYGIRENRGFVVITGGVGLGKTTVLLSVVSELESDMDVAIIVNPIDSFDQLLRMICEELGVSVRSTDEATLMAHLNTALLESYGKGRGCVLMLDEAQNLSIEVLEKVRTLSNLQTEETSLLQIVLVGQPELTAKLNDHRLRQLRQRIGVWHEIRALDDADTADYLWHRLALSGAADPRAIVSKRTAALIHKYSQGIPRLINQVCDTALVVAYGRGRRHVEHDHVVEAARELRLGEVERAPVSAAERSPAGVGRRRRRWLIAAVVCVVVVLITGAAWTQFGWSFDTALPGAPEESSAEIDSGSAMKSASIVPMKVRATPVKLPAPNRAAILQRIHEVEGLRTEGPVYAIHMISFRSAAEAREYASELVASHPDWTEPLYVEETFDRPAWFRVTAGGYTDRAEGVAQARMLKSELGLRYAKLTQLKPGARPLLPGTGEGEATIDE